MHIIVALQGFIVIQHCLHSGVYVRDGDPTLLAGKEPFCLDAAADHLRALAENTLDRGPPLDAFRWAGMFVSKFKLFQISICFKVQMVSYVVLQEVLASAGSSRGSRLGWARRAPCCKFAACA